MGWLQSHENPQARRYVDIKPGHVTDKTQFRSGQHFSCPYRHMGVGCPPIQNPHRCHQRSPCWPRQSQRQTNQTGTNSRPWRHCPRMVTSPGIHCRGRQNSHQTCRCSRSTRVLYRPFPATTITRNTCVHAAPGSWCWPPHQERASADGEAAGSSVKTESE